MPRRPAPPHRTTASSPPAISSSLPPQSLRNCTGSATLRILAAMTLPALLPSALQIPAASCLSPAETASSQLQTYAVQMSKIYHRHLPLHITRTADRSARYGGRQQVWVARFSRRRSRRGAREKGSGRAPDGSGRQPASARAAKGFAVTGLSTRAPLRTDMRRGGRSYSSKEDPRWRYCLAMAEQSASGKAPATARG